MMDMIEKNLAAQGALSPMRISLKEMVQTRIDNAQKELARQQELLELLEKHPELSRAIELLGNHY